MLFLESRFYVKITEPFAPECKVPSSVVIKGPQSLLWQSLPSWIHSLTSNNDWGTHPYAPWSSQTEHMVGFFS